MSYRCGEEKKRRMHYTNRYMNTGSPLRYVPCYRIICISDDVGTTTTLKLFELRATLLHKLGGIPANFDAPQIPFKHPHGIIDRYPRSKDSKLNNEPTSTFIITKRLSGEDSHLTINIRLRNSPVESKFWGTGAPIRVPDSKCNVWPSAESGTKIDDMQIFQYRFRFISQIRFQASSCAYERHHTSGTKVAVQHPTSYLPLTHSYNTGMAVGPTTQRNATPQAQAPWIAELSRSYLPTYVIAAGVGTRATIAPTRPSPSLCLSNPCPCPGQAPNPIHTLAEHARAMVVIVNETALLSSVIQRGTSERVVIIKKYASVRGPKRTSQAVERAGRKGRWGKGNNLAGMYIKEKRRNAGNHDHEGGRGDGKVRRVKEWRVKFEEWGSGLSINYRSSRMIAEWREQTGW
ncbi:hypothetical protein BJ165DRAFT_1401903 [Panaeolus papilionaceus]|nr:hypothetical protein BJ165DRAFT_1401903 [Panaeolus papilionaceus]